MCASGATCSIEGMSADRPFPFVRDLGGVRDGFRRPRGLADGEDTIIPGHDPPFLARHPAPDPSLEGFVARLD